MGNCSVKGVTEKSQNIIRVVSPHSSTITHFNAPKLTKNVLNKYPLGYGIFREQVGVGKPLAGDEPLNGGQFYYLLPLMVDDDDDEPPKVSTAEMLVENLEVFQSGNGKKKKNDGVWRVKLVINTKQLEEILAEEVNTEALIQKIRKAAALSSNSASLALSECTTPRKRNIYSWMRSWRTENSSSPVCPNYPLTTIGNESMKESSF